MTCRTSHAVGWPASRTAPTFGGLRLESQGRGLTIALQPEITVTIDARTDGVQVVCDVSPTGRDLSPSVLIQIGRALLESNQHGGWIATPDVIEVDGLDTESALTLVEQLLAAVGKRPRLASKQQ